MRRLAFVLLAACAQAPTTQAPTTPAAPITIDPEVTRPGGATRVTESRRGVYVGAQLVGRRRGMLASAEGSEVRLPADIERLGTTIFAEGHALYTARDGDDLLVLLADAGDVVTDDLRLEGKGRHRLISACHDDAFLGIAEPGACEETDVATPTDTIAVEATALVRGRQGIVCFCDIE